MFNVAYNIIVKHLEDKPMALHNEELNKLIHDVGRLKNASLSDCKEILTKLEKYAATLQSADKDQLSVARFAIKTLNDILEKMNDKNSNPNIRDAFKQLHPAGAGQQPLTMKKKS